MNEYDYVYINKLNYITITYTDISKACSVTENLVRRKNRSGRTKIYGNNPKIMVRPWNSGPACALAQYEGSIAHQLSKVPNRADQRQYKERAEA